MLRMDGTSSMALRRQLKNVVRNYTEAQIKIREATSNDPWGPSSSLMSEIADLTYNVVAFSEIMQMIWKRLNDHGKNWRHVYKSLVLLDYLVKTGSERVTQQCRENIFAIQTLKDFQYVEDGKDQGVNVRERAKQLVALLKDDERLKTERAKALKAKERFAQNAMGFGSAGGGTNGSVMRGGAHAGSSSRTGGNYADPYGGAGLSAETEAARPSTVGEEELQLQLALAMSKEEHDQEIQRRKHDDYKLELAMKESQKDPVLRQQQFPSASAAGPSKSRLKNVDDPVEPELLDIADVFTSTSKPSSYATREDPWSSGAASKPSGFVAFDGAGDPWAASNSKSQSPSDPWNATSGANSGPAPAARADPWGDTKAASPKGFDPFGQPASNSKPNNLDDFDLLSSSRQMPTSSSMSAMTTNNSNSPWDMASMGAAMPAGAGPPDQSGTKTPDAFLDPNFSSLVNLDQLITPGQSKSASQPSLADSRHVADKNPFGASSSNPFHQSQPRIPLNQMMQPRTTSFTPPTQTGGLPAPLIPGPSGNPANTYPAANPTNPFLMM